MDADKKKKLSDQILNVADDVWSLNHALELFSQNDIEAGGPQMHLLKSSCKSLERKMNEIQNLSDQL